MLTQPSTQPCLCCTGTLLPRAHAASQEPTSLAAQLPQLGMGSHQLRGRTWQCPLKNFRTSVKACQGPPKRQPSPLAHQPAPDFGHFPNLWAFPTNVYSKCTALINQVVNKGTELCCPTTDPQVTPDNQELLDFAPYTPTLT